MKFFHPLVCKQSIKTDYLHNGFPLGFTQPISKSYLEKYRPELAESFGDVLIVGVFEMRLLGYNDEDIYQAACMGILPERFDVLIENNYQLATGENLVVVNDTVEFHIQDDWQLTTYIDSQAIFINWLDADNLAYEIIDTLPTIVSRYKSVENAIHIKPVSTELMCSYTMDKYQNGEFIYGGEFRGSADLGLSTSVTDSKLAKLYSSIFVICRHSEVTTLENQLIPKETRESLRDLDANGSLLIINYTVDKVTYNQADLMYDLLSPLAPASPFDGMSAMTPYFPAEESKIVITSKDVMLTGGIPELFYAGYDKGNTNCFYMREDGSVLIATHDSSMVIKRKDGKSLTVDISPDN